MPRQGENAVPVIEEYKGGYVPAASVAPSVAELLQYVPPLCLRLLDRIVITNASGLDRTYAARPTTWHGIQLGQCFGLYHPATPAQRSTRGRRAYIELFIDNILDRHVNVFEEVLALLLGRSVRVAATLFHEVGHHIHETVDKRCRDEERAAERWGQKLYRRFVFTKRPWLAPIILPVYVLGWTWRILWFSEEAKFRRVED